MLSAALMPARCQAVLCSHWLQHPCVITHDTQQMARMSRPSPKSEARPVCYRWLPLSPLSSDQDVPSCSKSCHGMGALCREPRCSSPTYQTARTCGAAVLLLKQAWLPCRSPWR